MILRVAETLPLYDILNEFQKGHSHMAVVIKHYTNSEKPAAQAPLDSKMLVVLTYIQIYVIPNVYAFETSLFPIYIVQIQSKT